MAKPKIFCNFQKMLADGKTVAIVQVSANDTKKDFYGNTIKFYEGMPVILYSDDNYDENGNVDCLIAEGMMIMRDNEIDTKWWCVINEKGIQYESDIELL